MFDARKLLDYLVNPSAAAASAPQGLGEVAGQVGGLVGQVLSQATAGLREGAQKIDAATGLTETVEKTVQDTTGQTTGGLFAQAKDLIGRNQGAAIAAAGGLAAVLLGTSTGRQMVGGAARLGGLALIGGLAYKALQNYQAGKPLLDAPGDVAAAPEGSENAVGGDSDADRALLLVRAMIAAASADGTVDDAERTAIIGNLKAAGLDDEAAAFLDAEFAAPTDIDTIVSMVEGPARAAEVYTAARLAIDVDTEEEQAFLAALAGQLSLDEGLVAHIEAAAKSVKGQATA